VPVEFPGQICAMRWRVGCVWPGRRVARGLGCLACANCGVPLEDGNPERTLYRIGALAGTGAEVIVCRRCRPSSAKAGQWIDTARDPGARACSTSTTSAMKTILPSAATRRERTTGTDQGIAMWWNEDESPVAAWFPGIATTKTALSNNGRRWLRFRHSRPVSPFARHRVGNYGFPIA
jgi:hypothetical protein